MKIKSVINHNGNEIKIVHVSRMNYKILVNDEYISGWGSLEVATAEAAKVLESIKHIGVE